MREENSEIRQGFIRQRRNLMSMTMLLFAVDYLGLDFKQISLLGNRADIYQPEHIYTVMWVLLLYWLLRYAQYQTDLGDLGAIDLFYTTRNEYIRNVSSKKIFDKCNHELRLNVKKDIEIYDNRLWLVSLGFPYMVQKKGKMDFEDRQSTVILGRKELFYPNIKAVLYVCLKSHYVSEHLFPYGLVMSLLIYWLISS